MAALSAAEIAAMRATCATVRPDTASIYRASTTPDGQGGVTKDYIALALDVPCARWPLSGSGDQEAVVGARFTALSGWRFSFPVGTDIAEGDRVVHGGETLEVYGIFEERSYELAMIVDCGQIG